MLKNLTCGRFTFAAGDEDMGKIKLILATLKGERDLLNLFACDIIRHHHLMCFVIIELTHLKPIHISRIMVQIYKISHSFARFHVIHKYFM